jgi:hypothetical protein
MKLIFRKREMLQKRIKRSPSWPEVIVEYKGLAPGLKIKDPKLMKINNDFNEIYQRYHGPK